jgi:hypothetical protein
MSYDIIELQHELSEIQRERNEEQNRSQIDDSYSQTKARTASRNRDIDMLLKRGSTPCQVSQILRIPMDFVNARVARLERDEEEKREFFATGEMPSGGNGYVAIFR